MPLRLWKCKVRYRYPVTDPKAQRGRGRGIALRCLDLGARNGGWSGPRPDRLTPRKDPVPILQGARWAPEPVCTCARLWKCTVLKEQLEQREGTYEY
jgi:hypothetical protein